MKRYLAVFMSLLLPCATVLASGGRPGEILDWGMGARAMAMGGTGTASADDSSVVFWNPALIPTLQGREAGMMHAALWEKASFDGLNYAHPLLRRRGFGVSLARVSKDDFERRDAYNVSGGKFSVADTALKLAWGQAVSRAFMVGAGANYLNRAVDSQSSSLGGVDIAAAYQAADGTRLGIKAGNLLNFSDGNTDDRLPVVVRAGVSRGWLNNKISAAVDAESGARWHAGVEVTLRPVFLRFGMDGTELATGVGFEFLSYRIDYALAQHELGTSHRISFNIRWGADLASGRAALGAQYAARGAELLRKGQLRQALDQYEQAAAFEDYREGTAMVGRVRSMVVAHAFPDAPARFAVDRDRTLWQVKGAAIAEYADGKFPASAAKVDEALSLNGADREMKVLRDLLAAEGIAFDAEGLTGDTRVAVKMHRMTDYFKTGKFDLVIKECRDILEIDPNNVMALTRLGTAYYSVGLTDKALETWNRALELDPDAPGVREFLNKIK